MKPSIQKDTASRLPMERLINELQSFGVQLSDFAVGPGSRRGGAGPSDHKAMTIDGMTIMVPIHTSAALMSPYMLDRPDAAGRSVIRRNGRMLSEVQFPHRPKFYELKTEEGIPYSHIAVLHGRDVLATTVLQSCVRYQSRSNSCQFCAIGASLVEGRTIERKTPSQLAEVAKAAVDLDSVAHMVMTTGTPPGKDHGAAILCESAVAVKAAVDLAIQVQCEPPDDFAWFGRLRDAGADTLGMHLEAVTEDVRRRIMPGKAQVPVTRYFTAFQQAVAVFGRGQVSTYILAGLGDPAEEILKVCSRLTEIGVYPFVVPFVPISGTPLEKHPAPSPALMDAILRPLAEMLVANGLTSGAVKAGCAKCGACSALSVFERNHVAEACA